MEDSIRHMLCYNTSGIYINTEINNVQLSEVIVGSRNHDRKLGSIFELVLDIRPSNNGVKPTNLRDGPESEIACQCRDHDLHLQDSKPPSDARTWTL